MVWKSVQVRSCVDYIKSHFCSKCVPKFVWNTIHCIGSFVGKALRCHREIIIKRLNRRKRREMNVCTHKSNVKLSTCVCKKCRSSRYNQRKRVIESDFLANLAYNQRVPKNNETSMDADYDEPVGEIALSPGETWWNKVVNQRSNMPPLFRGPLAKPTKSEYSSATSGFRSATPDALSEVTAPSRSVSPLSLNTENSGPAFSNSLSQPKEGSKSESKISPRKNVPEIKYRMITRSVTNNALALGIVHKEGRVSTIPIKRTKIEKRRKLVRSTSHGSDCFSTCARCSRILSKAV